MPLVFSFILLLTGALSPPSGWNILILAIAQGVLLLGFIREKHVTSAGAFVFMSFLFFGIRPLYVIAENDLRLLTDLFLLQPTPAILHDALVWATAGSWCFCLGVIIQRRVGNWKIRSLVYQSREDILSGEYIVISPKSAKMALGIQAFTCILMASMSHAGRGIYGSALGAYAYDLPMVFQGVQVFGVVVAAERWRVRKNIQSKIYLGLALALLVLTYWMAREVTIFRGAYITPLLAVCFCLMFRYKGRVNYIWLITPIILLFPLFRMLGESRALANEEAKDHLMIKLSEVFNPQSYWHFFDSGGDMNIYDTFVAANEYRPTQYPYLKSWLYVPFHIVPRKFWSEKPEKGVLQDLEYTNGAPYSPGIAGFFLGDGGRIWMLGSMAILGTILSWMDMRVLRMQPSYFKICAYGILVVNAIYLTRFFLWQYTYQVLYMLAPCWLFSLIINKRGKIKNTVSSSLPSSFEEASHSRKSR